MPAEPALPPPKPTKDDPRPPSLVAPKEMTMPFVPNQPTVVIVGADKGGVGKTTLSRVILDYFAAQGMTTRAFDTESPKGDLIRFFPSITEVVNLRDSDDQVKVFDSISNASITLIDIRAGLLTETLNLLSEIGFLDMVKEGKVNTAVMHVIGSTLASFGEIEQTSQILTGAKHCIVLNRNNSAEFFKGIDDVARQALSLGTSVIDVPMLDPRAMEHVDSASVPFGDFEKDPKYSFVMRGKVRHWEKQVFTQLDAAQFNIH
ncbi:hypothetical protein [Bradyrhizobium erythrophlei]|nr:hypothetical protein [Bradyrhizobium erythrophlei]